MATKVTTESGRVYVIDRENGFWKREPKPGEYATGWAKLWTLKQGDNLTPTPWSDSTFVDCEIPEVGKFMYIGARDFWWTSTRIAKIEETEGIE